MLTTYGADYAAKVWCGLLSPVATAYLTVATQRPGQLFDAAALQEPVDPGFVRQPVLMDNTAWASDGNGIVTNLVSVEFPAATTDWGPVGFWALADSQVDGEILIWGEMSTTYQVTIGSVLTFDPGTISVSFTNFDTEV